MNWGNPTYLYIAGPAVIFAALLYLYAARRRRALARVFAEAELYDRLADEVDPRRRTIKIIITLAVLGLMILAAARLRAGLASELAHKEGIDLVVALDVSKSMLAADIKPTRFDRARAELLDLISRLEGDRVGIVIFSGSAYVQCPLTTDYAAARTFLRSVHIGSVSTGGTAVASAIDAASDLLIRSDNSSRIIMLLTDGENTVGDPAAAAARAAEKGIRIFAVGIGAEAGEPLPLDENGKGVAGYQKTKQGKVVLSRLDEKTLMDVTRTASGDYRRAGNAGLGIEALWSDIESLERGLIETRIFTRYEENFSYFLLPAVLLLLLDLFLSERKRYGIIGKKRERRI